MESKKKDTKTDSSSVKPHPNQEVKAWAQTLEIPTYEVGKPEKNPVFLEKRVYQGSSGMVYPFPVIEKIYDEKKSKSWKALFLENEYLKIMILPELGGRVQMAIDKTNDYNFVYYNRVIKPALVGLTGPWVSGGIEFNWPQHHRPNTFGPVEYELLDNRDGSQTVITHETDRMYGTKGQARFTLYPGKAYLEITGQLYNRTPLPQTFLWWANPAVHVDEHYQSIFPPDVNAVFDHGKRDVSDFPVATGTYYKVDYSPGTDISWYKNIPVPTSYMAIRSQFDFVGGYHHQKKAGILHVADHHISPGKKQWTWGCGDFGKAWDRNLTDDDGPYVELMCGVYTDNQPDFSWLMPGEEKRFTQYFMPFKEIGYVKNASKEALINLVVHAEEVELFVYTTSSKKVNINLYHQKQLVYSVKQEVAPDKVFKKIMEHSHLSLSKEENFNPPDFRLEILDEHGNLLIDHQPLPERELPAPQPANPALPPKEVLSCEQLYLTGLHLEQYRHATYEPAGYYREALHRDPEDIQNNQALGKLLLRRGQFQEAESYLRQAIHTLTARNLNPFNTAPYYYLGLALKYQNRLDEAYDSFFQAIWKMEWQNAGFYEIAKIDIRRGHPEKALNHVNQSLVYNKHHVQSLHLKAVLLRKLGKMEDFHGQLDKNLNFDPFDWGSLWESLRTKQNYGDQGYEEQKEQFKRKLRYEPQNFLKLAFDYADAGLYNEAQQILLLLTEQNTPAKRHPFAEVPIRNATENHPAEVYPVILYALGTYAFKNGQAEDAEHWWERAKKVVPDYCFPNQLEELDVLNTCLEQHPKDSKAWYYLGNLWYHFKQYDKAVECWEASTKYDPRFPTANRNLALVYFNKQASSKKAQEFLKKAFHDDPGDSRILMELDQLYKRLGEPPDKRLALLEDHQSLVMERDDLYLEWLSLYNLQEQPEKALRMLMDRNFHPWEGGEGKVTGQYEMALIQLARKALKNKELEKAIQYLTQALTYPENLGEGKLYIETNNDIHYWLGQVYHQMKDFQKAEEHWQLAAKGTFDLGAAMFYNDLSPDKALYKGLAFRRLGKETAAYTIFKGLIEYGQQNKDTPSEIDYFAVSLPDLMIWDDDQALRHRIHCQYLTGLGNLGLGHYKTAKECFQKVLKQDPYHFGAVMHGGIVGELEYRED